MSIIVRIVYCCVWSHDDIGLVSGSTGYTLLQAYFYGPMPGSEFNVLSKRTLWLGYSVCTGTALLIYNQHQSAYSA